MVGKRVNWLFAAALALTSCGGSGPGDVVRDFYRAVERGDVDRAVDLLAADALRFVGMDILRFVIGAVSEELSDAGGIDSIEILAEEVDERAGGRATVRVRINFGDGSSDTEDMDVVREDGRYKVVPEF